jgi:hypothetical protein
MKFGMVKSLVSQVMEIDDFTDNEGTTGFCDFAKDLPAGAIPLAWRAKVTEGFDGDTTAVVQVGIEGDVNKYSANTAQSCLAVGTVGSLALALDAMTDHDEAQTPRVTVTGGTDFGGITAGAMQVELFYIEPAPID